MILKNAKKKFPFDYQRNSIVEIRADNHKIRNHKIPPVIVPGYN